MTESPEKFKDGAIWNVISKNMIVVGKRRLLNNHSFILWVFGSGKLFTGKAESANLVLSSDADIIIIKLKREYSPLVKAMGNEVIEIFATGSKQSNVNTDNRLICCDILELGEQLRVIGMLLILDSILNRITANRKKGKLTLIFIDEIYLQFMHEYSAQFLLTQNSSSC